jgi:short subunit dehydrogenase-like uncharacterized protein
MLYGAYGTTGRRILQEAVRRAHRPLLAGRNGEKLAQLARPGDLPWCAVELGDRRALTRALEGIDVVLHAAGPYVITCEPMLEACLDAGVSYLDITGELPVFQRTLACHERALHHRVLVCSGVGFEVVPTDCLVAYLARRTGAADGERPVEIEVAYSALGDASRGTVKSALGILRDGSRVLRGGRLVSVPLGRGGRSLELWQSQRSGRRERMRTWRALPAPLPDLLTAQRTTGTDHVTAYLALPRRKAWALEWLGPALPHALRSRSIYEHLLRRVEASDLEPRARARASAWARVQSARGESREAWLDLPDGYTFTAQSAVRAVEATLSQRPVGALTPALAFGEDFVLEVPTVRRRDPFA